MEETEEEEEGGGKRKKLLMDEGSCLIYTKEGEAFGDHLKVMFIQ